MKPSLLVRLFAACAALAGAAAGPIESGVDRPGGEYAFVPASDATACAAACANDQLCLAWTYRVHEFVGCELKAVVPRQISDADAASGVADRAATFLALTTPPSPAERSPAPSADTRMAAEEPAPPPPSAPVASRVFAAADPAARAGAGSKDEDLLGGP
ncbi:MAG: PAN domain-containing protein [Hyphomonadaceae bacterium]